MKKVRIIAVGKVKEDYIRAGIAEYQKRLSRFCRTEIIELKDSTKDEEGGLILQKLAGFHTVLFDPSGRLVTSEQLSELTDRAYLNSPAVNFVIGGSDGVSDKVRDSANDIISLGKVTFPHMLFRLIALEQIYRGFTIAANLPYHK